MPAPQSIVNLVERFHVHVQAYKKSEYGETQVRVEYINPFFEAMGWDVHNKLGYAEAWKDVVHEDAVRIAGVYKAPDYGFRMGGRRIFFVEAKKPSVDLRGDVAPAFQVRRYAWSAKLPLSILTDFEELAVYDCRVKPDKGDSAAVGRVMYLHYTDYVQKWDDLAGIFAPESIRMGSFDAYVDSNKVKRGTTEVDDAFLADIERWRELLARSLALRNPALTTRELNHAVQQTLDRIIFLRICEARGLEAYGLLLGQTNGSNIYERLMVEFRRADNRYNSGIFHFANEKGQAGDPDELTPALRIDDKVLKEIITNLYYPESPYEFAVIPADILGQIYEQFLGKVIRLTAGHQAKVEEKPEVKKAGGVYYTPTYIVDYIVRQTVGKLVSDKRPGPLGGVSKLRIVDPACGSGSFLLGAYQYLLDWHLAAYMEDGPEQWAAKSNPQLHRTEKGDWKLTLDERKRILLNNIFGVDIDAQAVEVTKLSLLLKVLEGESGETLSPQMKLIDDRLLPDLGRNIRCGNSLIGPDYYDAHQMTLLDEDEMVRINVFDWHAAFPGVFAEGGFDAVIGNPPYIRIQAMKEWAPIEVEFYKKRYKAASKGNYDIYVVFVEKGLSLLRENGQLGFILPHKFFNAQYGEPLREIVASNRNLHDVVYFGDQQVFHGATTYTCLFFASNLPSNEITYRTVKDLDEWSRTSRATVTTIPGIALGSGEWNFGNRRVMSLASRLEDQFVPLSSASSRIYQGPITGADDVYVFKQWRPSADDEHVEVFSVALQSWILLESEVLKRVVRGGDIGRYYALPSTFALFPYGVENSRAVLHSDETLRAKYPAAWHYLLSRKQALEARDGGKLKGPGWYRYGRTQNLGLWEQPKLMVPYMVKRLATHFDADGSLYFINVTTGGYGLTPAVERIDAMLLCGFLNSSLLNAMLRHYSTTFRGGYIAANKQYIERLPIALTDANNHILTEEVVERACLMLTLHTKLQSATLPHLKEAYRAQIAATDRRIDELVYELYGLTDKEVAIVEGQAGAADEHEEGDKADQA